MYEYKDHIVQISPIDGRLELKLDLCYDFSKFANIDSFFFCAEYIWIECMPQNIIPVFKGVQWK